MEANKTTQTLRHRLGRMHRDEGGAIVVLAFAGCLFLFLVGLTLYDAGFMARDKVDVQNAADTAAYSQAAVKARAMNMVSFANVGKRTIVGIGSMYFWQQLFYFIWWVGECSECCCWPCGCWDACRVDRFCRRDLRGVRFDQRLFIESQLIPGGYGRIRPLLGAG